MKAPTTIKITSAAILAAMFFIVSCDKQPAEPALQPIINYSYWIFDSVEGTKDVAHFTIDRKVEVQYDPNVDKCYMENWYYTRQDTFDRSPYWKRGYVNRNDFFNRIIFNGDTITIHHNVQNQVGQSGFRYIHGVKL